MEKYILPISSILGNFLKFSFFLQALPVFENFGKWPNRLLLNERDTYCDF